MGVPLNRTPAAVACWLGALMLTGTAHAQDGLDAWGDDAAASFDGFDAERSALEASSGPSAAASAPSRWGVGASLYARTGMWTTAADDVKDSVASALLVGAELAVDYRSDPTPRGGARFTLRARGGMELDAAPRVQGQTGTPTGDAYTAVWFLREAYGMLAAGPIDLSLGRLIEVWGQGEVLGLLDLINPRDLRRPGVLDLEAQRLGMTAARLGYGVGAHRLELTTTFESRFGLRPPPLDRRSPARRLLLDGPVLGQLLSDQQLQYVNEPGPGFHAMDVFVRWTFAGPGYDLAVHVASLLDRQGVALLSTTQLPDGALVVPLLHPRYELLATSGVASFQQLLLRWELVYEHERGRSTVPADAPITLLDWQRAPGMAAMLGFSYLPSAAVSFSSEVVGTLLLDRELARGEDGQRPLLPPQQLQLASQISARPLDGLSLEAAVIVLGVQPGGSAAVTARVEQRLATGVSAELGVAVFFSGYLFGPLYGLESANQAWLSLRWDVGA